MIAWGESSNPRKRSQKDSSAGDLDICPTGRTGPVVSGCRSLCFGVLGRLNRQDDDFSHLTALVPPLQEVYWLRSGFIPFSSVVG